MRKGDKILKHGTWLLGSSVHIYPNIAARSDWRCFSDLLAILMAIFHGLLTQRKQHKHKFCSLHVLPREKMPSHGQEPPQALVEEQKVREKENIYENNR